MSKEAGKRTRGRAIGRWAADRVWALGYIIQLKLASRS